MLYVVVELESIAMLKKESATGPDLRDPGPPTNRGPLDKPFILFLANAYETTT